MRLIRENKLFRTANLSKGHQEEERQQRWYRCPKGTGAANHPSVSVEHNFNPADGSMFGGRTLTRLAGQN